jgi:hypothetical protein
MKNKPLNSEGRSHLSLEEKRKVRCIKMSDHEWQQIRSRAAEESMSASKYIREKALGAESTHV